MSEINEEDISCDRMMEKVAFIKEKVEIFDKNNLACQAIINLWRDPNWTAAIANGKRRERNELWKPILVLSNLLF